MSEGASEKDTGTVTPDLKVKGKVDANRFLEAVSDAEEEAEEKFGSLYQSAGDPETIEEAISRPDRTQTRASDNISKTRRDYQGDLGGGAPSIPLKVKARK